MFPPTVVALEFLAGHATTDAVIGAARVKGIPDVVTPKLVIDVDGRLTGVIRPDQPGYAEHPDPEFVVVDPR
jgi:hypothetical protein